MLPSISCTKLKAQPSNAINNNNNNNNNNNIRNNNNTDVYVKKNHSDDINIEISQKEKNYFECNVDDKENIIKEQEQQQQQLPLLQKQNLNANNKNNSYSLINLNASANINELFETNKTKSNSSKSNFVIKINNYPQTFNDDQLSDSESVSTPDQIFYTMNDNLININGTSTLAKNQKQKMDHIENNLQTIQNPHVGIVNTNTHRKSLVKAKDLKLPIKVRPEYEIYDAFEHQKHIHSPQNIDQNGKLLLSNIRLPSKEVPKKRVERANTFKVTFKPKSKNGLVKLGNKTPDDKYYDYYHQSSIDAFMNGKETNRSFNGNKNLNSDNYHSINDNLANYDTNVNYFPTYEKNRDDLKPLFNYKQLMYLKFNTPGSNEFDSYYNQSRQNIMKQSHSHEHLNDHSYKHQQQQHENKTTIHGSQNKLNKVNSKVRSDFISNSYFSLKLPKLHVANATSTQSHSQTPTTSNSNLHQHLHSNSTSQFSQHSHTHQVSDELNDEINRILKFYPSINSKRGSNKKLPKLSNYLNENSIKYETTRIPIHSHVASMESIVTNTNTNTSDLDYNQK